MQTDKLGFNRSMLEPQHGSPPTFCIGSWEHSGCVQSFAVHYIPPLLNITHIRVAIAQ